MDTQNSNAPKESATPESGKSLPFEWDKHPIIIAAGSVVATALLLIQFFNDVIIPNRVAVLESEATEYRKSVAELQAALDAKNSELAKEVERGRRLATELESLQASVTAITGELLEARSSFLLAPGNPYPNGLSIARIGMTREQILKIYSGDGYHVDTSKSEFISVRLTGHPIRNATYYFDETCDAVTHVGFQMDLFSGFPEDFLQRRLMEAFGQPTSNPRAKHYRWLVSEKWNVLKHDELGYVVLPAPQTLAIWPRE